jgi:hypothetical protein
VTQAKVVKKTRSTGRVNQKSKPKRVLPARRATVRASTPSRDTTMMLGGLALVVLVIGDAMLLSQAARVLRA